MSAANQCGVLNIALDASAKAKPIILTSTKIVTTTKTTRHVCLGKNDEKYDIGLNELQSFLEEEPKKRAVKKKKTALKPHSDVTSSNRHLNNTRTGAEMCKQKKKLKTLAAIKSKVVKSQAQNWTESDTNANTTTDDEGGRRGLISSKRQENDEILSSTINTSGQSINAEANEFWKENSLPTFEPAAAESDTMAENITKHPNESHKQQIVEKKSKRDINDIMKEALLTPMDANVTCAEDHSVPSPTQRKLSAIFETSAELNANVTKQSPPPMLDKSPIIEKIVSNHYKQIHNSTPPPILVNEGSPHKIASAHSTPSPTVVVSRRTTRVFSTKLFREHLHMDEADKADAAVAPSKRKTRRNTENKANKMLPLEENDDDKAVQSNQNELASIPIALPSGNVYKSKARGISETSNNTDQSDLNTNSGAKVVHSIPSNDLVALTPSPADAKKSKSRRNTSKKLVNTNLNPIQAIDAVHGNLNFNSVEVEAPKRKARNNIKNRIESNLKEQSSDQSTNSNKTTAKTGRTKKVSKQVEKQSLNEGLPEAAAITEIQTTPTQIIKSTKCVQSTEIESIELPKLIAQSVAHTPPAVDAKKTKLRRNITKKLVSKNLNPFEANDAVHDQVDAPIRKTRNNTMKTIKTNLKDQSSNQSTNSNKTIAKADRTKKASKQVEKHSLNEGLRDAAAITEIQTAPTVIKSTKSVQNTEIESKQLAPEASISNANITKRTTIRLAIASNTIVAASPRAKRGRSSKKNSAISDIDEREKNKSGPSLEEISAKIEFEPAKTTASKRKRQAQCQSSPRALNESLLFEAPANNVDATKKHIAANQQRSISKRLIIYSPSRDKSMVKRIDGNRVIIPKSMVAKAICKPKSGVLMGMNDNGMIIDANERLMYSPREGEDINVKKEVEKGIDILEVLAKRRQSVFILQCQNR